MQIDSIAAVSAQELTEDDQPLLGFVVGDATRPAPRRTLVRQAAFSEHPGWVVSGSSVERWYFQHYLRRGEATLLVGPHVPGRPLYEVLDDGVAAWTCLAQLAAALRTLQQQDQLPSQLALNSIWCGEDGVLLFPATMLRPLTQSRSQTAFLQAESRIGHPDLSGDELHSYTLAVLAYHALTGRYPFGSDEELQLRNQIRNLDLAPLEIVVPGCDPRLADAIMRGLRPAEGEERPSLAEWAELLAGAVASAPVTAADIVATEQAAEQLRQFERSAERRFRRRVYLQRNGRQLVVFGVVALAAGGLLASLLSSWLAPRDTRGFSPREVVAAFYRGMNELDHTIMDDAVIGDAGELRIREVIHLFLVSRQVLAAEARESLLSADVWVANGRPTLPPGVEPYGPANLELADERGPPTPTVIAQYEMYSPAGPAALEYMNGELVRERAYLRLDGSDWVIYQFEPLPTIP